MKRKNLVLFLIVAILGFALMSGGCGGGGSGDSPDGYNPGAPSDPVVPGDPVAPSDPGDISDGTWKIVSGTCLNRTTGPVQNFVKDSYSDDPITVEITENADSLYTVRLSGPDVKYEVRVWHREGFWSTVSYPNGYVEVHFSDGSGGITIDRIYGETGFTAVADNKLSRGNENDDNQYGLDGLATYEVNGSTAKYTNIYHIDNGGGDIVRRVLTINFGK